MKFFIAYTFEAFKMLAIMFVLLGWGGLNMAPVTPENVAILIVALVAAFFLTIGLIYHLCRKPAAEQNDNWEMLSDAKKSQIIIARAFGIQRPEK